MDAAALEELPAPVMTVNELIWMLEGDYADTEVVEILEKILRRASEFYEDRDDMISAFALCIASMAVRPAVNPGNLARAMAWLAYFLLTHLRDSDKWHPETRAWLERIRDTDPYFEMVAAEEAADRAAEAMAHNG